MMAIAMVSILCLLRAGLCVDGNLAGLDGWQQFNMCANGCSIRILLTLSIKSYEMV